MVDGSEGKRAKQCKGLKWTVAGTDRNSRPRDCTATVKASNCGISETRRGQREMINWRVWTGVHGWTILAHFHQS